MSTNTPLQKLVHEIERLPPDAMVGFLDFVCSLRVVTSHPAANASTLLKPRAKLFGFAGVLSDSTHWNEHPLDIQGQMLNEWALITFGRTIISALRAVPCVPIVAMLSLCLTTKRMEL